jgi:hypothetical protein
MTGTLLNIIWVCSVEWLRPGRYDFDDVEQQGRTQPTMQRVLDVRQPEREPDHSPPSKPDSKNLTFRGPCIVIYSYNKTNEMH